MGRRVTDFNMIYEDLKKNNTLPDLVKVWSARSDKEAYSGLSKADFYKLLDGGRDDLLDRYYIQKHVKTYHWTDSSYRIDRDHAVETQLVAELMSNAELTRNEYSAILPTVKGILNSTANLTPTIFIVNRNKASAVKETIKVMRKDICHEKNIYEHLEFENFRFSTRRKMTTTMKNSCKAMMDELKDKKKKEELPKHFDEAMDKWLGELGDYYDMVLWY